MAVQTPTTTPCASGAPFSSLRFCAGQRVIPGIRTAIYYTAKENITAWPTLPSPSDKDVTLAKLATYDGNFTLKADKKWQRIDLVTNKGNVEWETQGERPSCTFLNKLTASHPGTAEEAAGFCSVAQNADLVFLVQQRDGKFRVLGNEMFETVVKPKGSLGEGTSTNASTDIEIEAADVVPAPFYPGEIDTADDGKISGATGKPVAAA